MNYPEWITPFNLGTFSQAYSFEVNPVIIQYSAGYNSVISLINGHLPAGLRLEKSANVIRILGACVQTSSDISVQFTLRIIQTNGEIADRTYYMTLKDVPLAPSWKGQDEFLGYQNNTLPQAYQLTASVSPGQYITYSIQSVTVVPNVSVTVNIDPLTGLLTCNASNVVVNNTIITVVVRAAASLYSDISCTIEVITAAGGPEWITPAGSLGTFAGDEFIEIMLEAKDLDNLPVTYSLISNANNAPLKVAADGLLYGRLPNVTEETTYSFTVQATSSNSGSSNRSFSIIVVPNLSISLLKWITDENLGFVVDGSYINIPIVAETKRKRLIIYNLSGGNIPPNVIINKVNGTIEGFCEYHAVPKTYNFDISATDGYQTITKQFTLQVNKQYNDIFFGISVPLSGRERSNWVLDAANVRIREPGTKIFDTFSNIENPPSLNIIRGVITGYDNDNKIFAQLSPWLNQFDFQFGLAANTAITSNNTVVFRNINDYQQGSNLTVYSSAVYNTNVHTSGLVEPISIENIRRAITTNRSFIASGGGNGLVISPELNWSTGSITSVSVINTGSNYISPPIIEINGSGSGADLRAKLGLVDIKILNPGINWLVGDVVEIRTGIASVYARITVTEVGPTGKLISYTIDEPGDYSQVPVVDSETFERDSETSFTAKLIWGIASVEVVNGGMNYQNDISFNLIGKEILPWWQNLYFPAVPIGNINGISGSAASTLLNSSIDIIYGNRWQPNYAVFYWEGIRWIGSSTFDVTQTTFDGNATKFEESESAYETIFDDQMTQFEQNYTTFDYEDPLTYDQASVWGSTIFDNLLTIFEYYSTVFDRAMPRKTSRTVYKKFIRVNNKVYSGNNAVW